MSRDVTPLWKQGPKPKRKKATGRARPDEPMALDCEVRSPVCVQRPTVDRHHRLRRSRGGSDDRSNTLDACDPCHDYIHDHPAESYERGWLVRGGR